MVKLNLLTDDDGEPTLVHSALEDEMARTVFCVKLGREAEGFEQPPFPGALGQRIYDGVSIEAYELWQEHATILINHYGLHPADPETRRMLRAEMEEFFFGDDAQLPEGWAPPGAGGGAPAQKKK